MSTSTEITTTSGAPTLSDREALAILGSADSADSRLLISEAKGDFLPYDSEYEALVELVEVKPKKNFDSRGLNIKLTVKESNAPKVLKVNQSYTLCFFDQHKTLPSQVLAEMAVSRIQFAAVLAQYEGDPLEEGPDGSPVFKTAPVFLPLVREVQPLGIKLRIKNTYIRSTRNGKKLHKLSFELV